MVNDFTTLVKNDPTVWTSARGIQFKLSPVAVLALRKAEKRFVAPKVPVVWIEEKGRNESNPNDPEYLEILSQFQEDRAFAVIELLLTLGSKASFVPEELERPEDVEWAETLNDVGFEVPEKGGARYLAWLQYYALPDHEELLGLAGQVKRVSGIIEEEDVAEAAESFPDNSARDSDNGVRFTQTD